MSFSVMANILVLCLAVNAILSFSLAFYWQAKVILTIYSVADQTNSFVPWKALGNPKSPQNTLGRFLAGDFLPDLRRKWLRAIAYAALSFLALFLVVIPLKVYAPEIFW